MVSASPLFRFGDFVGGEAEVAGLLGLGVFGEAHGDDLAVFGAGVVELAVSVLVADVEAAMECEKPTLPTNTMSAVSGSLASAVAVDPMGKIGS